MPEKYKNKYRIQSHRMPGWDYSGNGMYFITLVTQNRDCNLGEIVKNKIILSDFGIIVKNEWEISFEIRDELFCDDYIIMPNHLHAIVIIEKPIVNTHVDTHGRAYQQSTTKSNFIRKPKSISSFIAGFKSAINSKIDDYIDKHNLDIPKYNRNNHFFQSNYHDHIIRNDVSFQRIKNYIINNPLKWNNDNLFE